MGSRPTHQYKQVQLHSSLTAKAVSPCLLDSTLEQFKPPPRTDPTLLFTNFSIRVDPHANTIWQHICANKDKRPLPFLSRPLTQ